MLFVFKYSNDDAYIKWKKKSENEMGIMRSFNHFIAQLYKWVLSLN